MEKTYKQLLEKFIDEMNIFYETGFDDGLQELEKEVSQIIKKRNDV